MSDLETTPGRRRVSNPLTKHVPVRFRPEVIESVKYLADADRKTVSSWIRDLVEAEIERRRYGWVEFKWTEVNGVDTEIL